MGWVARVVLDLSSEDIAVYSHQKWIEESRIAHT